MPGIEQSLITALLSEAAKAHPRECCGILLGEGNRITASQPTANVHPRPDTHFEIDPQALVDAHRAAREGGPRVLGYYHSHPAGMAEPSATDQAMATGDGRIWAIIAGETVKFWRDGEEGFEALSYIASER
ncbi:MAG: M67 family metallopeptidase [Sphingomonadaceae bacterium]|nr:M67 family metallopeptidase [Sphingomonadaceae bacterium]